MKTLLVLAAIVIAILLALLWFNSGQVGTDRQELKQAYTDSLQAYADSKAAIQVQIRTVEAERSAAVRRDSISKVTYKLENDRLKVALIRAKTGKVVEVIDAEPQLRYYIAYYDSLTQFQELRIDTLEIERRIATQLCDTLVSKKDSLIIVQGKENIYLQGEVGKRDEIIKKQDKKLRRQKWWIRATAIANLIPRFKKY